MDELKRPDIPQKVSSRVNYLWKQSCGGVDDDNVKMRCEDIEKLLFPSEEGLNRVVWNTTRQDERRVRLPLCYNNILTGLASYVPKLHDFSWKVKEVLGNTDDKYLDIYKGFGDTLTLLVKNELREINWKDLLEDFVLRSLVFPASVLKVTYMSKYVGSTDIQGKRSIEDQIARLVVKIRDAKLGINSDDKLNQEIIELESAISQESELLKWDGINIENVPLENWRYDRSVWSLENLHLCGWQSHDIRMRVDDIKQRFLFSLLPQANEIGMEFEGIHPVDIGKITHDANDIVLVRELWSRDDNRVYILVDGVDYPVRTFVPQKTTSQWYPFYVFVNNRIPNDVIGVSDIELQKEMQTRINRKLSDDEKFRWLSLPRFVYDKTSISNCELKELLNTNPGELIGVELLNRESNLGNLIMPLQYQYSPYAVDVSRDEQYLRRFSYIPQQVQGEQGRANFAAEVDAGIGGMDLMTSFKMSKMENFLERVYNGCGELMILNNSIENVKKIVGSRAVWSIVLGDKESDVLSSQVKQEAMELAYQQSLNQALTTGKQIDVPTLSALISEIEGQILIEKIGIPFIISRNSIFKNLQVGISVSMDKNADKYQKLSALQTLMTSLQLGAQAGMQSGLRFNPEPLLMGLSSIFGLDADLSRIYEQDISMELQSIAQQISMNPGLLTPQFMSAIQGIIGIISQIQGGVNNGDRTRKGNESSGAKARGDASSQGR